MLQQSVSFLVEHAAKQAREREQAKEEKQFWPIHKAWLKETSARRAEENRIARAKMDLRGNEYRSSPGRQNLLVSDGMLRAADGGNSPGGIFSHAGTAAGEVMINPKVQRKLKRQALANVITGTIKVLHEHSSAWLFKTPVDWQGLGLLHYPMVVKHPIDLSGIQLFFEDGKYKRAETFAADILLMVQNCVLFNSRDVKSQKFVRLGKLMWKKFVKVFKMLLLQERIVFTQPTMLNDEDILETVDTVCTCQMPYNSCNFVVACDGECGGWYHPGCVGLIRCGDFLISVDEETGMEARRFDLSKSFICPMCESGNPKHTTFGKIASKTPSRQRSRRRAGGAAETPSAISLSSSSAGNASARKRERPGPVSSKRDYKKVDGDDDDDDEEEEEEDEEEDKEDEEREEEDEEEEEEDGEDKNEDVESSSDSESEVEKISQPPPKKRRRATTPTKRSGRKTKSSPTNRRSSRKRQRTITSFFS